MQKVKLVTPKEIKDAFIDNQIRIMQDDAVDSDFLKGAALMLKLIEDDIKTAVIELSTIAIWGPAIKENYHNIVVDTGESAIVIPTADLHE